MKHKTIIHNPYCFLLLPHTFGCCPLDVTDCPCAAEWSKPTKARRKGNPFEAVAWSVFDVDDFGIFHHLRSKHRASQAVCRTLLALAESSTGLTHGMHSWDQLSGDARKASGNAIFRDSFASFLPEHMCRLKSITDPVKIKESQRNRKASSIPQALGLGQVSPVTVTFVA